MAPLGIRGKVRAMRILLPALLALFAVTSASAADSYRFDTVHSQVQFRVSHLGFSESEGEFHDLRGGFRFDRDDWSKSSCDVTIGIASLDLDDEAWNRKLLESDWFDGARHPDMRFRCLQVTQQDEHHGRIDGELTLRGGSVALRTSGMGLSLNCGDNSSLILAHAGERSGSSTMASTGHSGTQAPQSMQSSGSMTAKISPLYSAG